MLWQDVVQEIRARGEDGEDPDVGEDAARLDLEAHKQSMVNQALAKPDLIPTYMCACM